tara:strand:+ start:5753 stop:5914 length:162 start_codon:yes stop_codon:yes gene_type:complete
MINFIIIKDTDSYICRFFYGRTHIDDFRIHAKNDEIAQAAAREKYDELCSFFD